jgi:hypothetical protein
MPKIELLKSPSEPISEPEASLCGPVPRGATRDLYHALLHDPASPEVRDRSRAFLLRRIDQASHLPDDLPEGPDGLPGWATTGALRTAGGYAEYLAARRAGAPRRYFSSRAHALWYLNRIAPTKLVDGAWLYGLLRRWDDDRLRPLLRTYLDEIGNGDAQQNHVSIYQALMAFHECDEYGHLDDSDYFHGALQLALGEHADQFLPEVIGYNLGYEQPPLHLLITAYELTELGIDSSYFSLHVTTDNASTGHARKATQAVLELQPATDDSGAFYGRIRAGYRLSQLGVSAETIIRSFDLEQEMIAMLERKGRFGHNLHSDFCRVGGRTVNQWLSVPGRMPQFLDAMTRAGWIQRHDDPSRSRLWQLIEAPNAPMSGVFSRYERQMIHDWIAGDWLDDHAAPARRRPSGSLPGSPGRCADEPLWSELPRDRQPGGADHDLSVLHRELNDLAPAAKMRRLIEWMSPARHTTPAGLMAARIFSGSMR